VNASSSGSSPRNSALAWSISPTTTPGPSDALPSSRAIRPSIAASSVDLPEPFTPVIATRSAQSICRSTGPRVNEPRRTTAPRSTATTAPDRGAAPPACAAPTPARLLDHLEPLDHPVGLPGLGRLLLARLDPGRADGAVRLGCQVPADVADALVGPGPLGPGPRLQPGLRLRVLLVLEAGVPALRLPLGQVAGVPAAVVVDLVLRQVELQYPVNGALQEPAVVADQDRAGAAGQHEVLQLGQPGPGRGRWSARPAAARRTGTAAATASPARAACPPDSAGHRPVEVDGEAELGGDRLGPLVQVGAPRPSQRSRATGRRRRRRARPAPAPATPRPARAERPRRRSAGPARRARSRRRSGRASCGR
jgi:hypothetical protein